MNVRNEQEYDIIIDRNNTRQIIECKFNPNNCYIASEHKKLIKRRNKYNDDKPTTIEFWFWIIPNGKTQDYLNKYNVSYKLISDKLNPKRRKNLEKMFNYKLYSE
jgi:hypothetical protein